MVTTGPVTLRLRDSALLTRSLRLVLGNVPAVSFLAVTAMACVGAAAFAAQLLCGHQAWATSNPLGLLLWWPVVHLLAGMVAPLAVAAAHGERLGAVAAVTAGLRALPACAAAAILAPLAAVVGLLVPPLGIALGCSFWLAAPIAAQERCDPRRALHRSEVLMAGNRATAFATVAQVTGVFVVAYLPWLLLGATLAGFVAVSTGDRSLFDTDPSRSAIAALWLALPFLGGVVWLAAAHAVAYACLQRASADAAPPAPAVQPA